MPRLLTCSLVLALCAAAAGSSGFAEPSRSKPSARIEIRVTAKGFEPDNITVQAGSPTTLVFTRKTDATCTKSVVLALEDGKQIERVLPLDQPVEIAATFTKPGKLGYTCNMHMAKGTIVVQ